MIQKTLNAIGVTYSHMNDDILVPSRIEAERTKQSLIVRGVNVPRILVGAHFVFVKKTRKRKSQAKDKGGDEGPAVQWPPKRQHHKPPPRPTDQLRFLFSFFFFFVKDSELVN